MASTTEATTHPLASVRQRRGLSQADIARMATPGKVDWPIRSYKVKAYRWEHGLVTPDMPSQLKLAERLGVPAETVADYPWPEWLLTLDQEEDVDAPWGGEGARAVLASVVQSALMDRRPFLSLVSGALVGMATSWADALPTDLAGRGHGTVTAEAVVSLQHRVEDLWRLDDALGGGGCLGPAVADLHMVSDLINTRAYDPEVGAQLFDLAGALSRFCGWVAFDAGRLSAAARYWHAGLRTTRAAGDPHGHGVYALSNLALATIYAGNGATALQQLEVARRRTDPAQKVVLSMLDCWAARAYAITGQPAAAAEAINRADRLWEARQAGDDPAWSYWMPLPSLTAEASTALADAGDNQAAERNLLAGLADAADSGPRDRALYLAQLAKVRARDGRHDHAADTAHHAVDLVAGVDSARVRDQVNAAITLIPDQRLRTALVDPQREACPAT